MPSQVIRTTPLPLCLKGLLDQKEVVLNVHMLGNSRRGRGPGSSQSFRCSRIFRMTSLSSMKDMIRMGSEHSGQINGSTS